MTHGARDRAGPKADFAQAGPRRAVDLGREQSDLGAVGRERVGCVRGAANWWRHDVGAHGGPSLPQPAPDRRRVQRALRNPDAILGRVSASAKGLFTAEGALVAAVLLRVLGIGHAVYRA